MAGTYAATPTLAVPEQRLVLGGGVSVGPYAGLSPWSRARSRSQTC